MDPEFKEMLYSCAKYNLANGESDNTSTEILNELEDAEKFEHVRSA